MHIMETDVEQVARFKCRFCWAIRCQLLITKMALINMLSRLCVLFVFIAADICTEIFNSVISFSVAGVSWRAQSSCNADASAASRQCIARTPPDHSRGPRSLPHGGAAPWRRLLARWQHGSNGGLDLCYSVTNSEYLCVEAQSWDWRHSQVLPEVFRWKGK